MESRDQRLPQQGTADQLLHALGHLRRRFVGKGDGEDSVRRDADIFDQVRNAVSNDARLAAAGTGKDQQRALGGLDRQALLRV